ncbi:MAG: serine hydrolase [Nocardiaceae bacterium]|nr:serine hydrolase [Nocardiaceae bacterium]
MAILLLAFTGPFTIANAEESTTTSAPPTFTTPNTDHCPNRNNPPAPTDTSEVPKPGSVAPGPLPIPHDPIGGPLLGRCGIITPAGSPPLPETIGAASWVVADLDTGEVLAAKDPHGRYRPASTLKILLALVALRELDLSTVITGTDEDANMDGSRVGIGQGGRYSNNELMQALLMVSGNDAANALAREMGGTEKTIEKMNAAARELGAMDTRAATVCGLDGPGMSISSYDLAVFFREAMRNSDFARLVRTEQAQFPGFPGPPGEPPLPAFAMANDNQLLYNYPGAIGGKTGFTDDAHHTYVGAAERFGRRLVVTILDADATFLRPWEQGARLLDYGFGIKGTNVGSLDGKADVAAAEVSAAAVPAATMAAPPAKTTHEFEPAGTKSQSILVRFAIGLLGGIVVCLLVLAAMAKKRR